MANDNVPKNYQISTKIGRFFFSRGEHGKCHICTLNREKCTDLVAHRNRLKKKNR